MSSSEYIPLSAAQRSVWYAQQLNPDLPICIAQYIEIEGPVKLDLVDETGRIAVREVVGLTIRLVERDGIPYQVLDEDAESAVEFVDLSAEEDPRAAAESWMRAEMAEPINLLGDRLYRIAWLRLGDELHLWYLRAHHLCIDGYGGALVNALAAKIY